MSIIDSREDRVDSLPSRNLSLLEKGGAMTQPNPTLTVISSGTPNATDATITWTSDILSDTTVFWGLTAAYAGATSPRFDPTPTLSHSIQITGLVTATTYHYAVRSRSTVTGGYTTSTDATFVTA